MADATWEDENQTSININEFANQIWSTANKLRGVYQKKDNGNVVLPMVVLRRFECVLEKTKPAVIAAYEKDHDIAPQMLCEISGYQFYNTSRFTLSELLNDADNLAENFKAYLNGFSANVQEILDSRGLKLDSEIDKMNKGGCLYSIVKQYSRMDLSEEAVPSVAMGHIFENLIRRSFVEEGQGEDYTARDIVKLNISLITAEGCDDIYQPGKVVTVFDQAAGTGGMLFTASELLSRLNDKMDIRLFGVEFNDITYAVGKAEMLIKHQDASNFVHGDTFKTDPFPDVEARFIAENPPFGTPWKGEDAKDGQEEAVLKEAAKENGRWSHGLPDGNDAQLIFMQSAIAKLNKKNGRAGIISDGTPLTAGNTSNGSSQIRRWMLENDLIEAIVKLPADLFYDTGITTYIWLISMNKRPERKGKIQLIDASSFYTKMRKPMGDKRNEISASDRKKTVKLYTDFEENEYSKIFDNKEFIYQEWSVYQPLQKSYQITDETIERVLSDKLFASMYDSDRETVLMDKRPLTAKEKKELADLQSGKIIYQSVKRTLSAYKGSKKQLNKKNAEAFVSHIFEASGIHTDIKRAGQDDKMYSKLIAKIVDLLGLMDKSAEIEKDKHGNIVWDKATKDTELIREDENVDEYMKREVLPYVPDAHWVFEEVVGGKKPVIKTGAEIPFTRYFYKYQKLEPSEQIATEVQNIEADLQNEMKAIFGGTIE